MRIHFIAIGGAVMHNLAIALHKKGYKVSGSDDEIRDPSKSRLAKYDLLPSEFGWFPKKITRALDVVILGMHARDDNPELLRAQELGMKIYSFPEYLYEQTKDKRRVVIGGSHGKTSITSMVMHVLKFCGVKFDYMVGSQLEGFETMVGLSDDAEVAIFEGDEYLSSPIDRRPKFHLYRPHIALLTGIAWDHINVFPTFENYKEQFAKFLKCIEPDGQLVFFEKDEHLIDIVQKSDSDFRVTPYKEMPYKPVDGGVELSFESKKIPLSIFGEHNMQNLAGAKVVCDALDIENDDFFEAMKSFKGAARRLEKVLDTEKATVFWDFAHAPSKLKATVNAVKEQYSEKQIVACMELHTFSSLNKNFLVEYSGALDAADVAVVFFEEHTLALKRLPKINADDIKAAFGRDDLLVIQQKNDLIGLIAKTDLRNSVLLMMSSGSFGGMNIKEEIKGIVT